MSCKGNKGMQEERKFLSEFIDVYKSLPALWDSKSKIYYDRQNKAEAYEILLNKYKERYPDATREDVTKKINAFRSNYRNGLRKYYAALKSAKNKDLVRKPSLWYFEKFSFLKLTFGNLNIKTHASNADDPENNSRNFNVNDIEIYVEKSDSMITDRIEDNSLGSSGISIKQEFGRKKYHNSGDYNENDYYAEGEREESNVQSVSDRGDEYYHWAMALAGDIRKMDKTQQIYAKKAIAEIVMEGRLGLLHRNSIKINDDPV